MPFNLFVAFYIFFYHYDFLYKFFFYYLYLFIFFKLLNYNSSNTKQLTTGKYFITMQGKYNEKKIEKNKKKLFIVNIRPNENQKQLFR
jgi:hypothetical protein